MNRVKQAIFALGFGLFVAHFSACKGNSSEKPVTDTTTITPAPADNTVQKLPDTAIVISADDSLKTKITDAVKDFPGVTATIDQGVITLSGEIKRAQLPNLMKAVHALHPKKINNTLTIK